MHYANQTVALLTTLCLLIATSACDDQTGDIGIDIMPSTDLSETSQAIYNVATASVMADSLIAFATDSYLGRVTDPETNATTTANFMAQFATLENDKLPDISAMHKEDGKVVADSVILNLYIKSYYGDSLNPMKIGVYELDPSNILPESKDYYTNIDPEDYVSHSPDALSKELSFAVTDLLIDDTVRFASTYSKNIRITLPADYGTKILRAYYEHPEYFKNSYSFIRNVVPGFYFKTIAGNGTMVNIDVSTLTIFFRYDINGKTYDGIKRIAATNEVIQCNSFTNRNLEPLVNISDYTFIKSPAAIFTEVTLPINEIYKGHENDSINTAKIVFNRRNNDATSNYALPVPRNLLLLPKTKLHEFFKNKQLPDNITSFVSVFATSYNSYTFSNISSALTYLQRMRNQGAGIKPTDNQSTIQAKTAAWEAQNPDWNKMLLVPVNTNTNSFGNIIDIYNDFSLSSTKLTASPQITVVYSSFNK